MAKSKNPDRKNTGNRGGPKTTLSRLELYLMGQGPTKRAERGMYKDSLKAPGAKPAKARA